MIDIGDAVLHEQMISKCKSNETMFSKWFENNSINDDEWVKYLITGGHYIISELKKPPDVYKIVRLKIKERLESIYA